MTGDIYEIGWWIQSADEELYGPASRETLRRFLKEGIISPNTLVRHCTEPEFRPVAEQVGITDTAVAVEAGRAVGDQLAEHWPRRWKQRLQLARNTLPCVRHRRNAVLFCLRCQAPYCDKCRAKPHKRPYYFCRRCQAKHYHARAGAYLLDGLLIYLFSFLVGFLVAILAGQGAQAAQPGGTGSALINVLILVGAVWFIFRDVLQGGAGPGKRLLGLRVVSQRDGASPLGYGQAILRWLSLAIPFFNLVDLSVPFRDPLLRRYGDRWAGTRVIETATKLEKVRAQAKAALAKKEVELPPLKTMTMEQFAQIG
jgi:uncharacterized RDD family membrane protein YckC